MTGVTYVRKSYYARKNSLRVTLLKNHNPRVVIGFRIHGLSNDRSHVCLESFSILEIVFVRRIVSLIHQRNYVIMVIMFSFCHL
jgi:hypothetical protein